jgi:hypothetical protein
MDSSSILYYCENCRFASKKREKSEKTIKSANPWAKLDPQISMRNINREVEKVEKGKKKKEKPWYFLFLSQILQITWI